MWEDKTFRCQQPSCGLEFETFSKLKNHDSTIHEPSYLLPVCGVGESSCFLPSIQLRPSLAARPSFSILTSISSPLSLRFNSVRRAPIVRRRALSLRPALHPLEAVSVPLSRARERLRNPKWVGRGRTVDLAQGGRCEH